MEEQVVGEGVVMLEQAGKVVVVAGVLRICKVGRR